MTLTRNILVGLLLTAAVTILGGWLLAGPINMGDLDTDQPIPMSALTNDIPMHPSFWLPLGGNWTDFELKASTNNFVDVNYWYMTTSTNGVADDPDMKVYFTDSGAADSRKWNLATAHTSIESQLTDTNSIVRYVIAQPSLQTVTGATTNSSAGWITINQTNLVWSYARYDGVDFERDGANRVIWTPVQPNWVMQRTLP